jgi:hypothetical protein
MEANGKNGIVPNQAWNLVRIVVAVILLAAAVAKGYQLATQPLSDTRILDSRWLLTASVAFELFFGLSLLVRVWPKPTWAATVVCFTLFACVSVYKAFYGYTSCGCFGRMPVNPWYTSVLDVAVVVAFLCWPPKGQQALFPSYLNKLPFHVIALLIIGVSVGIPAWLVMRASPSVTLLDVNTALDDKGRYVVLEPTRWVGKPFPLLNYIDVESGKQLASDNWLVILHRHDCPNCTRIIDSCKQQMQSVPLHSEVARVALIEVPQFDRKRGDVPNDDQRFVIGMLSTTKEWIVSTPVVLSLNRGIVVKVDDITENGGNFSSAFSQPVSPPRVTPASTTYDRLHSETACGPLSLLAVLDSMGVKVTTDERDKILQASRGIGTSMLQLKELAEELGLHTLGVEISLATLKRLDLHAIVLVNDIGFAAVTGYTDYGVQLVYPLKPPGVVADPAFERQFGKPGKALLFSIKPLLPDELGIGPAKEPVLRFSRNVLTVGRVYRPDWEGEVTVFNDGDRTIQIDGIKPSCTCVTATLSRRQIEPGESAILTARGKQPSIGSFRYDVVMTTDLEDMPLLKVPVRGIYSPPVFFEKVAIMVRDVLQGQAMDIDVPLYVADGRDLGSITFDVPKDAPIDAKATRAASGQPLARFHWRGTVTAGLYRYDIKVRMTDEAAYSSQQRLTLSIQSLPLVASSPPSFYVRDSEVVSKWWRHADIHINTPIPGGTHNNTNWRVSWSDSRFAEAILVNLSAMDQQTVSLRLSPMDTDRVKTLVGSHATLEIRTREGHTTEVRIYIGRSSFFPRTVDSNTVSKISSWRE